MVKSYVQEIGVVCKALLTDAKLQFPKLSAEFEKDQTRLLSAIAHRGLTAVMQDLPALCHHLDQAVDTQLYTPSKLHLGACASRRIIVPKLFRGLYLRLFDGRTGVLKEDFDVDAYRLLRQLLRVGAKTSIDCAEGRKIAEYRKFISVDSTLPLPTSMWERDGLSAQVFCPSGFATRDRYLDASQEVFGENPKLGSTLLANLDIVSGLLLSALGPYKWEEWDFKHGPGAVSDVRRGHSKYAAVADWGGYDERLDRSFPFADCCFGNYGDWIAHQQVLTSWVITTGVCNGIDFQFDDGLAWCERECGTWSDKLATCRLVDVLKNALKPRLIALQASGRMWCQQNIWHYMRSRTESTWIGKFIVFDDQTQNQALCLLASESGTQVTVDLSDASNLVSTLAVECQYRSNLKLLEALVATRVSHVELPADRYPGLPESYQMRKYASMGDATTFPIESLMFLSVALTSCLTARGMPITEESIEKLDCEVSVFGDDIIVPADCKDLLYGLLEVLDFKVNSTKSFWKNNFRESCGVDAYKGVDVTPAYWKAPCSKDDPESISAAVDSSNNFYEKFLVNTSEAIAEGVRREVPVPCVKFDSRYQGFKRIVDPGPPSFHKLRWNDYLQRFEFLLPVVETRSRKLPQRADVALLQYFTECNKGREPVKASPFGTPSDQSMRLKYAWIPVDDLTDQFRQPPVTP